MDTKGIVLVNNFWERLAGEAAERAVNPKHNLSSSYFQQKSGELFTLYCCVNFGLAFYFYIYILFYLFIYSFIYLFIH
jgi:hypothetical protein